MRLASSNRTVELPRYARGGLEEIIDPNIGKSISLSGRLTVDFMQDGKIRGGWKITFEALTQDEYTPIRNLYQDQFDNSEFLLFTDDDQDITEQEVFLNMPSERDLRWNKSVTLGLSITLEPRDADN